MSNGIKSKTEKKRKKIKSDRLFTSLSNYIEKPNLKHNLFLFSYFLSLFLSRYYNTSQINFLIIVLLFWIQCFFCLFKGIIFFSSDDGTNSRVLYSHNVILVMKMMRHLTTYNHQCPTSAANWCGHIHIRVATFTYSCGNTAPSDAIFRPHSAVIANLIHAVKFK